MVWLKKKTNKYTSAEIQNNMLQIMGLIILREIAKLEAHEDFIGLQKLERADASSITALIKDCLIRMNLSIHKVRGQCYDGCSTMSGAKTGVATQMKKSETRIFLA